MPQEELIAEQMAIHTCSTLIRWLVRDDPSVCRILEEILEEEETRVHAAMARALDSVMKATTKEASGPHIAFAE